MRYIKKCLTPIIGILGFTLVSFSLSGCATASHPYQSMGTVIHKYSSYAERNLEPDFRKAGVAYPPKQIALLAYKRTKRLQLWAKGDGSWRYIKTFPILAASGGPGPKLHNNDHQVPEGVYHIVAFNPDSRFDLSMELNYPNAFDRYHARLDHRYDLGDQIFIHGSHYSIGCIAIGNAAIPQLFVLADLVGLSNIEVVIAPDDLRYYRPVYGRVHPRWLPELYGQIRGALAPFKGHA